MVNCNPETVSTDYDTSDRLYFEPLTFEDVMNIVDAGKAGRSHRSVWRTDAAQSRDATARCRSANHRHLLRTRSIWLRIESDLALAGQSSKFRSRKMARSRPADEARRVAAASVIRCWCGQVTCWAAARW